MNIFKATVLPRFILNSGCAIPPNAPLHPKKTLSSRIRRMTKVSSAPRHFIVPISRYRSVTLISRAFEIPIVATINEIPTSGIIDKTQGINRALDYINQEMHMKFKFIVIFLFVTGLMSVFAYIFYELNYIKKKSSWFGNVRL